MKKDSVKFLLSMQIILLISSTCLWAQLNSVETEIIKLVDKNNEQAVKLLGEVVNINSGTMNFDGVKRIGNIFKDELNKLDFKTRWIDGKPFQRSGHLIAEHKGTGKHLLLIGHLDTVFEPESPFQQYKMVNENMMRGPGVCDMKGGDIIIIYALKALKEAGLLKQMHLTVIMTGDEERSGQPMELARYDLIEAAKSADISIGFENGDGDPTTAVIARRGSSTWKLTVKGNPAHSSQIFKDKVGAGAIYEISRILNSFYNHLSKEEYLTFSPGLILGGTDIKHNEKQNKGSAFGKNNVVAEHSIVTGDLRTISPEQLEKTKSTMTKIVKENLPGTNAEIIFNDSYPPLAPTDGNKRLLKIYDKVSRDMGLGPVAAVDPNKAGAADVSFTAKYVDMVIDGLGLGGVYDHTVNETGDLRTLPVQTKRAAIFLYRLSNP